MKSMRFDNWLEAFNYGLSAAGYPLRSVAPSIGTHLIRKNGVVVATISVWDVEDKYPYLARICK